MEANPTVLQYVIDENEPPTTDMDRARNQQRAEIITSSLTDATIVGQVRLIAQYRAQGTKEGADAAELVRQSMMGGMRRFAPETMTDLQLRHTAYTMEHMAGDGSLTPTLLEEIQRSQLQGALDRPLSAITKNDPILEGKFGAAPVTIASKATTVVGKMG